MNAGAIPGEPFLYTIVEEIVQASNHTDPQTQKWQTALSLALVFVLVISSFVVTKFVHKIKYLQFIPESGVIMLFGLLLGLFNWLANNSIHQVLDFNMELFDFLIIPAIIFESGYSLKKKGLFKNITTIALYALFGTLISTLFIGFVLFFFAKVAGVTSVDTSNPAEALVFGAIVSAIDPVATLALLGDVFRVRESSDVPLIYNLIFGESVVNDAVSIVLFRIMITFVGRPKFTAGDFFLMIGTFIYVSLGSIVIGVAVGFATAIFFKYISLKANSAVEILVLGMMAMGSYLLAEAASLSGIMSLFACGIVCGRFAWYNLSEYSRLTSPQTFKALSTAAESYVFLYLGISAFKFPHRADWKIGFIAIAIVLCIVARALNIFPLTLIANIRRKQKISWRESIFMWFNGLRGAIAFALALQCVEAGTPNGSAIVTTTLSIVLFSVWVFGTLSLPLLHLLGLNKPQANQDQQDATKEIAHLPGAILVINERVTQINSGGTSGSGVTGRKKLDGYLSKFDNKVLRPLLRKRYDQTSPHMRDLLLGGSIPSSLKIEELPHDEYEELCAKIKPAPKLHVRDMIFGSNTTQANSYEQEDSELVVETDNLDAGGPILYQSGIHYQSTAATDSDHLLTDPHDHDHDEPTDDDNAYKQV